MTSRRLQGRAAFQQEHVDLVRGYAAREAGLPTDGVEAQALATRHVRRIAASWRREPERVVILGLADMDVADERFAAAYGGPEAAAYVRDALHARVTVEG